MQYFHFQRLIKKYSRLFTAIIPQDGEYNNGEFEKKEPKKAVMTGAILDLSEKKIYRTNGTLTQKDKQMYIDNTLFPNLTGAQVVFDGNLYDVQQETENYYFTGFSSYVLRYVSAFKEE